MGLNSFETRIVLAPSSLLAPLRQTPPGPLLERSVARPERGFSSPESLVTQNRRNSFHTFLQGFLTIDSSGACIVSAKFSPVIFAIKTN